MSSDLEVDVNGEQVFLVNKGILARFSTRLRKLFHEFTTTTKNPKVVFDNFPGGAVCFELIARFCYNNGNIDITLSNLFQLYCGAIFLEMDGDKSGISSLVMQCELYLKGLHFLTWPEFVNGLKQCQNLFPFMPSSVFQDFLKCFLETLTFPCPTSPCTTSSSDRLSFQFSGDISTRSESSQTWRFDDLVFLDIDLFEMLIRMMISLHFDHSTICSFLLCYQKSTLSIPASRLQKGKRLGTIIDLLFLLNCGPISARALLDAFGTSLSLKMKISERVKLDKLLGMRLDQFTIDDLLVPNTRRKGKSAYNVSLIMRLLEVFLHEKNLDRFFQNRVKKVGRLIDLFTLEVAPDPCVELSKFVALVTALPDYARDSHETLYRAIDIYFEVHRDLPLEGMERVCGILNYNKLSVMSLKHLAENPRFQAFKLGYSFFFQQDIRPKTIGHKKNPDDIQGESEKVNTSTSKLKRTTQMTKPDKSRLLYIRRKRESLPRLCRS